MTKNFRLLSFGAAALFVLNTLPGVLGQNLVKADIPFEFHAGSKTMPAGAYEFKIDRAAEHVTLHGPKGGDAIVNFVTTMAAQQHVSEKHAHVIFDKVGSTFTLSELWQPGEDGILLNITKGKHEHEVIHVKP